MDKNTIVIYWCPAFALGEIDWNMLYPDFDNLYDTYRPEMTDSDPGNNFFYCPAFKNLAKNTFLLKNPIETHFVVTDNGLQPQGKNFITSWINRPPSMNNRILIEYGLQWLFFSEDDIEITLTSPYFHHQPHMDYGTIIPGRFNISTWFRTVNLEFNLNENQNQLKLEKDETLAYISFNTDKKILFKRFENNFQIESYAKSCGMSSSWESWIPLKSRYERFKKTRMKDLILKQIKNNLL